MTGISRNTQREALARRIEAMRPSVDGVHEAMLEATQYGVTYAAIAGATGSTELRAQRWSAGADIPGTVSERRAILSTLQRLLSELPSAADRRRRKNPLPESWRIIDERANAKRAASDDPKCVQCKTDRAQNGMPTCGRRRCLIRQANNVLCMNCMRNRNNGDVTCTSRNCRNKVKA